MRPDTANGTQQEERETGAAAALKFYAEGATTADQPRYIVYDIYSDRCYDVDQHTALSRREMLFACSGVQDQAKAEFVRDGYDRVSEVLGLDDSEYYFNERIPTFDSGDPERPYAVHPQLRDLFDRMFKTKLCNLDGLVFDCDSIGWGDVLTNNVLEVISAIIAKGMDDILDEKFSRQLVFGIGILEDDYDYAAVFQFSHFEAAINSLPDDDIDLPDKDISVIFACYQYVGLKKLYTHEI